jgi:hypothetical protein
MPDVGTSFGWQEIAIAFTVLALAAFLVTWLVTDVLGIGRGAYIAILSVTVLALSAAYLSWSDMPPGDLLSNPLWGALAGVVAAAIVFPLVRKLPGRPHAEGGRLAALLAWEGVVYGIAEATLLATLPVVVIWQATGDSPHRVLWGALAVVASLVVVLVHHLGYAEFRARSGRTMLRGALFTCGLQALAFLLTGSIWAPVVAHILLHGELIMRGVELPPAAGASGSDHAVPRHAVPHLTPRQRRVSA